MHDEIAKHGRQALDTARRKELPLAKKIKEVALEIFIIVFAVTLSISLHSWSENRHEQQQVNEFLIDVREDLQGDIEDLEGYKQVIDSTFVDKAYLLGLSVSLYDSLRNSRDSTRFLAELSRRLPTAGIIRNGNDGNYEGFKSSGKIGYIRNTKLKKRILAYYEQTLPATADLEGYYNANVNKMGDMLIDLNGMNGKDIFLNARLRANFKVTHAFCPQLASSYEQTIRMAQEIIAECGSEEEH